MSEEEKRPLAALEGAERYVEVGPEGAVQGGPHGRLGGAARKVLFRLLRPYTARHKEFERSVLAATVALDAKVDALDAKVEGLREEAVETDNELLDRLERIGRRLDAFEAVTDRTLTRIAAESRRAAEAAQRR